MLAVLFAVSASAHIVLDAPTPRYPDQKIGPCGTATDLRTTNVGYFTGGDTVTVEWHETINHPSHFRIAFDEDGTDDFLDPATQYDFYTNAAVLLDDIADEADETYSVQVTLPDVTCTSCTLQLIQVMYDKPPYGDGNDIYYQCADLELTASGATATGGTGGTGGTGDTAATAATGDTAATPTTPTPPGTPTGGTGGTADTADTAETADTGAPDDKGCGCAGAPAPAPGSAAALLLALAVARRRVAS